MTLAGWSYYATVEISNSNATDLLDFQVLITLNADNFDFSKAKSDGSDIRFTLSDGESLIPHWIEEWDTTNQNAKIWVKVPSIPASGTATILLWCGNPDAVDASDGDTVFEFFDDFNGDSLDESKWTLTGAAPVTIEDSKLKITGVSGNGCGVPAVVSNVGFSDYVVETLVAESADDALGDVIFWLIDTNNRVHIQHETRTGGSDGDIWETVNSTSQVIADYRYEWQPNEFVKYKITVVNNTFSIIRGAQVIPTITEQYGLSTINRKIGFSGDALQGDFIIDYIFVRKYADEEPTVTIGTLTYANTTIISATLTTINVSKALETFTGDGATSTFTVQNKPVIPKVRVYVDGTELVEGTDFTVDYTNGTITFATAPASGANIEILYFYGYIDVVPNATVNITDSAGNVITSTTTDSKGDYSVEVPTSATLYAVADTTDFDAKTEFKVE